MKFSFAYHVKLEFTCFRKNVPFENHSESNRDSCLEIKRSYNFAKASLRTVEDLNCRGINFVTFRFMFIYITKKARDDLYRNSSYQMLFLIVTRS